jgi:hypothetical protein
MDKSIPQRRGGEGTLAWIAFIAIAMVVTAALITTGVRHMTGGDKPTAAASSAASPSTPAPAPLPKPGVAPNGAALKNQNA